MPKIVNYDEQRRRIADATLRLIRKQSLSQATVRHIAEEAGISAGALRHCFQSQDALFAYVMQLVAERVKIRIDTLSSVTATPTRDAAVTLLSQLIPLDEERETEMAVWLTFSAIANHHDTMQPLNDILYTETRQFIHRLLESLQMQDDIRNNLNLTQEAETLHLLIDGLSLHRFLQPSQWTEATICHHLHDYLCSLQ